MSMEAFNHEFRTEGAAVSVEMVQDERGRARMEVTVYEGRGILRRFEMTATGADMKAMVEEKDVEFVDLDFLTAACSCGAPALPGGLCATCQVRQVRRQSRRKKKKQDTRRRGARKGNR